MPVRDLSFEGSILLLTNFARFLRWLRGGEQKKCNWFVSRFDCLFHNFTELFYQRISSLNKHTFWETIRTKRWFTILIFRKLSDTTLVRETYSDPAQYKFIRSAKWMKNRSLGRNADSGSYQIFFCLFRKQCVNSIFTGFQVPFVAAVSRLFSPGASNPLHFWHRQRTGHMPSARSFSFDVRATLIGVYS